MLLVYSIVLFQQINGNFQPQNIVLQFSDEVRADLTTYSGKYSLQVNKRKIGPSRIVYRGDRGDSTIGWCPKHRAWTFGIDRQDYCENIMSVSSKSTTTDISLILNRPWYVISKTDKNRLLPLNRVYSQRGCLTDEDCGSSQQGTCQQGYCDCQPGYLGLRCQYEETKVCENIKVNELTDNFTGLRRRVSVEYVVLRNSENGHIVAAYDHPVYIEPGYLGKGAGEWVDIIVYGGLRWLLTSIQIPESGKLEHLFGPSFHASPVTLENIEATTEEVHFNTATDETPVPTNLKWLLPESENIFEINPILGINTVLLCKECDDEDNPCAFDNECDSETRSCKCGNGEKGSLCQVIPLGDGKCDRFFNAIEFDMDDGDCCEASCRSSNNHKCGVLETGNGIDSLSIGFPFCVDPNLSCKRGEKNCWTIKSNPIPLLVERSEGASVYLNANGRTVVIAEPELDTVRVFDQVDSVWEQRGQTLEGRAKSRFGSHVSISALPGTVIRRRAGKTPIVIAVSATVVTTKTVEVFSFAPYSTLWERLGQPLSFNQTVASISIGNTGQDFHLAIGLAETNDALIYRLPSQDQALVQDWKLYWRTKGSTVGVAGDGSSLLLSSVDPYRGTSLFNVLNVSSVDDMLPNRMPSGATVLGFNSHPVWVIGDYHGTKGIAMGLTSWYSRQGLSLFGASRDGLDGAVVIDRVYTFHGSDNNELDIESVFSVAPDTNCFAVNSDGTQIEVFDVSAFSEDVVFSQNSSSSFGIPPVEVQGYGSRFSLSDGCKVMAIVDKNEVRILEQKKSINGTVLRLAMTLDEEPGSISWSVDYFGLVGNEPYATENILSCDHCYDGDPRYTRVVVAVESIIPVEREGCVQVTFELDRDLSDGAGFVSMKDGASFLVYEKGTRKVVKAMPGNCVLECSEEETKLDVIMHFGSDLPFELQGDSGKILWRSIDQPLPGTQGGVLIRQCLEPNEAVSNLTLSRASSRESSAGFSEIYLDETLVGNLTFDIGKSQTIDLAEIGNGEGIYRNTPGRCDSNDESCSICSVCPDGMVPSATQTLDIGGFSILCLELFELGFLGQINTQFCDLYPDDIISHCECRLRDCPEGQVAITIEIDFDASPSDISFFVRNDDGAVLWQEDFGRLSTADHLALKTVAFGNCLPQDHGALHFRITDSSGDGLCCDSALAVYIFSPIRRGYRAFIDNELVGERIFLFGNYQELVLGSSRDSSQVSVQDAIICPGDAGECTFCHVCPGGSEEYANFDHIYFENEGSFPCEGWDFLFGQNVNPDFCERHQNHIASSCGCRTHTIQCETGKSLVSFILDKKNSYQSISVRITDQWENTLFTKMGFNATSEDLDIEWKYEACIPAYEPVIVQVFDAVWWNMSKTSANPIDFEIFLDGEGVFESTFSGQEIEFLLGSNYTLSPASIQEPNLPPSPTGAPVVSLEPGDNPPCNICGDGRAVSIYDAILIIPGETETPTCAEFEYVGSIGWIPADQCGLAQFLVDVPCGCSAAPLITTQPSESPISSIEPMSNPPCSICGEGKKVTLLETVVNIPGREETPTCAEFEQVGSIGWIEAEDCAIVPLLVGALCGCE